MKIVLWFVLLWFVLLMLTLVLILPMTNVYQDALKKYEDVVLSEKITVPPPPQDAPYRYGFAFGYILNKFPLILAATLLTPFVGAMLILLFFKWLRKEKNASVVFSDPLESVKNVLSNLLLFMFGVFNRRASNQLSTYFDLPFRSRVIGGMAYALVFIAITWSYKIPGEFEQFGFIWLNYLQVLFVIVLLSLVLFYKKFRVNYQRRLLWLSLAALLIVWSSSLILGVRMAQSQLQSPQPAPFDATIFDPHTMFINILIVLAFSFYIEIIKQVATQKAQVDAEMAVARRIQHDLLPVLDMSNNTFSLYGRTLSASEVGGDYCDAVKLTGDRYAIAVGDVSGHNVVAGVMMSMLKVAFRTELKYLTAPEKLVASLNTTLYDHKNKNMFVSLMITLLDPVQKKMTIINGGHPPLLHYSSVDESVNDIRTGDMALGLKRDASYTSRSIRFEAGDVFVLYSDGLIETANARGEELNIQSIVDTIRENAHSSAADIYHLMLDLSVSFRGSVPQRDDMTIVVIKMHP